MIRRELEVQVVTTWLVVGVPMGELCKGLGVYFKEVPTQRGFPVLDSTAFDLLSRVPL